MKMTAGYRRETDVGTARNRPRKLPEGGSGTERTRGREERIFFALGAAAIGLSLSLSLFGAPAPRTEEENPSQQIPRGAVAVMSFADGKAGEGNRTDDPEGERRADPDPAAEAADAAEDAERSVYDEIGRFFARLFPGG